jgi:hypothetical protein
MHVYFIEMRLKPTARRKAGSWKRAHWLVDYAILSEAMEDVRRLRKLYPREEYRAARYERVR